MPGTGQTETGVLEGLGRLMRSLDKEEAMTKYQLTDAVAEQSGVTGKVSLQGSTARGFERDIADIAARISDLVRNLNDYITSATEDIDNLSARLDGLENPTREKPR